MLQAENEEQPPQIGRFILRSGPNELQIKDVRHGSYRVVAPTREDVFILHRGTEYELILWGTTGASRTAAVIIP